MATNHPKSYVITAPQIVRGLFDRDSSEALLLEIAACGKIRLIAKSIEWNKILWLLVNSFKNSDFIMKNGLLIGCHQGLNKKNIEYIHLIIQKFLKGFK